MATTLTDDERAVDFAMKRAAAGAWLLISFGGTVVLVLLLELLLILVMAAFFGAAIYMDPSSPFNNTTAAPTPTGVWAVAGVAVVVFALVQVGQLLLAALVSFGGYNLLKLRSRRWAFTGAVGVIVATFVVAGLQLCASWVGMLAALILFPLGVVAAVLSLMALADPAVEEGFRAQARLGGWDQPPRELS